MQNHIMSGILIDEHAYYSVEEICIICKIDNQTIQNMMEYGIIEPDLQQTPAQQFSYKQLKRLQLAFKLAHDLEMDVAGLGFSIDLLEEVQQLRQEIKILRQLLQHM